MSKRCISLVFLLFSSSLFSKNPVIVISIDGLRPDAIVKAKATTLLGLIATGTSFAQAKTVPPSLTLPAHTSMLTGLDPSQHGIFFDDYLPAYGPVRFETALEVAHRAGFHAAMFVAEDKLLHLNRPNSVDYFEKTTKEGLEIAMAFKRYVNLQGLPDVTFLHLPDPDSDEHSLIKAPKAYLKRVRDADYAVASILKTAALESAGIHPTIILTANYGGFGFGHLSDNDVPFIAVGDNIAQGLIKQDRIHTYDIAPTILLLLGLPIPKTWIGKPAPIFIEARDTVIPMSLGKSYFSSMCQAKSY